MSSFADHRTVRKDALKRDGRENDGLKQGALSPSLPKRAAAWLLTTGRAAQAHMMGFERLDLLLLMSLLLMLLYTTKVVTILAIAGLVYRPLARHPLFWLAIAAIMALTIRTEWFNLFNHDYVITYWALLLGLALWWKRPDDILAGASRLILGFLFLFAVLWKASAPEFPNGAFFEFTLMSDPRFQVVGEALGGMPTDASEEHRRALSEWGEAGLGAHEPVDLRSGALVPAMSQAMAAWTLAIESLVAILFLVPSRFRMARWAEPALIVFILSTYVLAPVVGFGWVLILLAMASTTLPRPIAHVFYPLAFVVLVAFQGADEILAALLRLVS